MIDKIVQSMAEAMAGIRDGSVVLLGGFGSIGQPNALIDGLIEQGAKDLTVVSNNAGTGRTGLARLLELGRVRKIVCSYPRSAGSVVFEEVYRAGKIELEIVPQGTMSERMRAAGAGIPAFFTATAVGTKLAAGKEERDIAGRKYLLEEALCRRRCPDRGLGSGPLGQPDLPVVGAQFQSGDGNGGGIDHRAGAAHRRARRARPGKNRHARLAASACPYGRGDSHRALSANRWHDLCGKRDIFRIMLWRDGDDRARHLQAVDARRNGRARRPRYSRRLVCQSRHRRAAADRRLCAGGARSHFPFRERRARHGTGAGAGRDQSAG